MALFSFLRKTENQRCFTETEQERVLKLLRCVAVTSRISVFILSYSKGEIFMSKRKITVADIGATNERWGLYEFDDVAETLVQVGIYQRKTEGKRDFANTLDVPQYELGVQFRDCAAAVFAVACPLNNNNVLSFTNNREFQIDKEATKQACGGIPTSFINDGRAQGYGVGMQQKDDYIEIYSGAPDPSEVRVFGIVGAGSGLLTAHVVLPLDYDGRITVENAKKVQVLAGEGGHVSFAVNCAKGNQDIRLQKCVRGMLSLTQDQYVSVENLISGEGVARIHYSLNPRSQMMSSRDITKTFDDDYRCDRMTKTFTYFSKLYARAVRNIALCPVCTDGMIISGGIAIDHPKLIQHPVFLKEFHKSPNNDAIPKLLRTIPISLVRNTDFGLQGAAFYALKLLST